MSRQAVINLQELPSPDIIEILDYEVLYELYLNYFRSLSPNFDATVESDPVVKLLQATAYRELMLRQRINDAAKGLLLAYAQKGDLDQLGANFGVQRFLIKEADNSSIPPVEAVYEDDASFKRRIQMSWEAVTTAGSIGSYEFHALSASPEVKDVDVSSPSPGKVDVTVLSAVANGYASDDLIGIVSAALNLDDVRPLTDQVTVRSATVIDYNIEANLTMYDGPDAEVVRATAEAAVRQFSLDHHRLGHDINLSGLYAALHIAGVQNVEIVSPAASVSVQPHEAAYCSGVSVSFVGRNE